MSRSGYSDDCDNLVLYRRAVDNAIAGKRGQAFLREMAAAMDAMPVKELIADDIVTPEGQVCAIGTVALARRLDMSDLETHDQDAIADRLGIARALAAEIAYMNDEHICARNPADRWTRMREWVDEHLEPPSPEVIAKRLRKLSER